MRPYLARLLPLLLPLLLANAPAAADTVVAARTLRVQALIGPADLAVIPGELPGTAGAPDELIGLEARAILYPGRPIRLDQVGPPAVIDRNAVVPLLFAAGGLAIATEGRALDRAGVGDRVRVMNLDSKKIVTGRVREDGAVEVGR